MNLLWTFLALSAALLAAPTLGQQPDCGDPSTCHASAYCLLANDGVTSYCECPPGMIDMSSNTGANCDSEGWTVRYVADLALGMNPTSNLTLAEGLEYCPASAQGYFLRSINSQTE
eukprot:583462-Rhodomonas_salina.1